MKDSFPTPEDPRDSKKPNDKKKYLMLYGIILSRVISAVALIFLCIFGGKWLDDQFHSSPLFLVVGVLGGLMSSIFYLKYYLRKFL